MIVAVESLLKLDTVAAKLAEVTPDPTVTLPGTLTTVESVLSMTVGPPAGAAAVKVTVQLDDPAPLNPDGEQLRLLSAAEGFSVTLVVRVTPFALTATVTVWVLLTDAAVAVNVPDVAPAATVTEDGTVRLPLVLETATVNPPLPAEEVRPTVQVELPGVFTGDEHDRVFNPGGWTTVIDPPMPDEEILDTSPAQLIALTRPIPIRPFEGVGETVIDALAITPLSTGVAFSP